MTELKQYGISKVPAPKDTFTGSRVDFDWQDNTKDSMHDLDKIAIASLLCLSLQSQPLFDQEDLKFNQSVFALRAPGSTFEKYGRETVYDLIALSIDAMGALAGPAPKDAEQCSCIDVTKASEVEKASEMEKASELESADDAAIQDMS